MENRFDKTRIFDRRAGFWLDYVLLAISLIIIWGAIVYFFYALNITGIIATLLLSALSFWRLYRIFPGAGKPTDKAEAEGMARHFFLMLVYLASAALAFHRLFQAVSEKALISPWQVVNQDFFWFYAISAISLAVIAAQNKIKGGLKTVLISSFYFLSFSVAAIVYKIGYGFDPFVHQATMELIAAKGAVLPKTPYYLGEYGLIVTLSKIGGFSIAFLNRFLVPFLAALFLPANLSAFLEKKTGSKSLAALTAIFILALTFSPFIMTTPQNLSYLFLALAVLAAASAASPWRVLILSLASAAIHPISGLPALALSAWIFWKKYDAAGRVTIVKAAIWLFTALAIPAALFWSAGASVQNLGGIKTFLTSLTGLIGSPTGAGQETFIANFTYFLAGNYCLFIILAIVITLCLFNRSRKNSDDAERSFLFLSSALLAAYFLSGQIIFDSVIYYEQSGYASRLPVAIMIFMLPSLARLLGDMIARIGKQPAIMRITWVIFGAAVLTAGLYISYPRFDKYHNSHGYSTSASDIAAVSSIASDARGSYIVLANQQVSAAALKVFGFDHYYQTTAGELYFYPIPTGSPLYGYYLDMVYKSPSRENMAGALDLAGADTGYLIINKYWYQSGRVISEAKQAADKWWTIRDEDYIFKYKR